MKTIIFLTIYFKLLICLNSATVCKDHAFVAIAIVEKKIVESFIEPGFNLPEEHPFDKFMEKNEYPMIFEFGEQLDCIFYSSLTKHSFIEFKLEIPFVSHSEGYKGLVYKPVIFASSYFDSIASKLLYGLPVEKSEMKIEKDYYEISTKGGKITLQVNISDERWHSYNELQNLNHFNDATLNPWYCFSPFGYVKCASLDYLWENSKIRPVELLVKIEGNILGEKLNGFSFKTLNIKEYELGSFEMDVPIEISFPYNCKK